MAGSSDEGEPDGALGTAMTAGREDGPLRAPADLTVARLLRDSPSDSDRDLDKPFFESARSSNRSGSESPADLSHKRKNDGDITLRLYSPDNLESTRRPWQRNERSPDKLQRLEVPHDVPADVELRGPGRGVWARHTILRGKRFGPFLGTWTTDPIDSNFAWEVRIPGSGMRGFFDGSLESSNWLKFVRSTSNRQQSDQNVRHFLVGGHIYYETLQEVRCGEELLLGPRDALQLDMFADSTCADERSETASQHSGTLEDDREDIEDEENETRCSVCHHVFADIEQLDEHLVSAHKYPHDHYKCEQCPRAFSWRPGLLRHQTLSHGEVRKYPCENCNKVFTDPSNLQRHIRTHHVGARSHACPECGKTFATSSGLKQHTHIHSSVKPFQCEVCLKSYTQFSNLCRHKRMHVNCRLQIKCIKCGQSFSTVTSLTKHRRFCESTSSPITGATASLPASPAMNSSPGNPFLLYPRPFYPTALLPPYPPLFHSAVAQHPPNFPMFMPKPPEEPSQPLPDYHARHLKRRIGDSMESPIDRKSMRYNDHVHVTPPVSSMEKTKVSPPTAEEAVSLERPSPARPPVGSNTCSYPDPREHIPQDGPKPSKRPKSSSTSEPIPKDQPLDLTVCSKRKIVYTEEVDKRTAPSPVTPKATSPSITALPDSPKRPTTPVTSVNESSDRRPPSPRPERVNISLAQQPMAYPRPIHPMLLDMYRPSGFTPFTSQSERMLQGPPPSPFSNARPFPFLGSLMNGLPNSPHGQRSSFDLLRSPMQTFAGTKPYQDVLLGNGVPPNGKMKDRYGCKYCGKIFPRSANLTRHVRTHTGEQPYKCQYCERSFSISSNLQRHVRNIHNKEKPFKCPLCERCFGQQTNLDRHLKKHEADDGTGTTAVADSPESNENEREDACFDEIRMFMGKVYNQGSTPNSYSGRVYSPPSVNQDIDVVKDDEDEEDTLSDDHASLFSPKDYSLPVAYDLKMKSDQEMLNNNTPDHPTETIKVAA